MTDAASQARDPGWSTHVAAGALVSVLSVCWTVVASTIAIVLGIADRSLVLIVFGSTGLLDAAGSLAIALHFRHAISTGAMSSRRERFALRLVSMGLIVIGVSTIAESTRRIITGAASKDSPLGIAVAAASAVVLAGLTIQKRKVARRISSDALMADSWLSATGSLLATITVAGTGLAAGAGRHWIDPAAALVVALLAAGVGVSEFRREARALDDDQR